MHKVTFDGFKTAEAAQEFMSWFEGQGEQDITEWWYCRDDDKMGKSPTTDMSRYSKNPNADGDYTLYVSN